VAPEDELQARSDAAYGALVSGWGLANAGLGAAHGFASGLGGMFAIPHGLICAAFLNPVLGFNKPVIAEQVRELLLACYEQQRLKPAYQDFIKDPVKALQAEISVLIQAFELEDALKQYRISKDLIPEIARRSAGSSMSGNPLELTQAEKEQLLAAALL
jgi:alcohol dehydrogenase class IV